MEIVRFGSFCLMPGARKLLDDGKPVPLGSRAFDILLLLVERAGTFVSNAEIVERVWPTTVVAPGNLRVHLSSLRKALGDDVAGHAGRAGEQCIVNVPNRGYSFVREVARESAPVPQVALPVAAMPAAAPRLPLQLPLPLNRVIGHDLALQSLLAQLRQHRFVTLVGAGGIGKTTLALLAAREIAEHSPDHWQRVYFVDLASLGDESLVPSALAAALGVAAVVADAMPNLLAYLHDKPALLIFDNCEHLAAGAAALIEDLLRGAPRVSVLATSREALRAAGEWVQRVQPLPLPPTAEGLDAREALRYPAVALFVERASAVVDTFTLSDADVPAVVHICRRLDGIPLALELAAARTDLLGVEGVARAVDDCMALLGKGRRTALPRHQTLRATMDWSFGLLTADEQALLPRLSVFAGAFPLEAAVAVAAWGALEAADIFNAVSGLVAKSLVTVDGSGGTMWCRLLDTTRAYAVLVLQSKGEAREAQRRHAVHCLDLLAQAGAVWPSTSAAVWQSCYGRRIDDVRRAMDWAFGTEGDVALGAAITASAAPLFFQLSFVDAFCRHAERALAALAALARAGAEAPRLEFALRIVYGTALYQTRGLRHESASALARALAIAQDLGDADLLRLAYVSHWIGSYTRGEPREMLQYARRFAQHAATDADPATMLLYDRMVAPSLHLQGDQRGARACAERGLAVEHPGRAPFVSGAQIDRRVSLGTVLARVLWVQGLPEQAEAAISRALDIAVQEGESVALAFALGFCACPLAIASGRWALARERVDRLVRHAREHSLLAWLQWGQTYDALLQWHERGAQGTPPHAVDPGRPWQPQLVEVMAVLHPVYVDAAAVARVHSGDAGWCAPEVHRVVADRLQHTDPSGAAKLRRQALAQAKRDGALAWELRIATGMARAGAAAGEGRHAAMLLDDVLGRVTEGDATPDVRDARAACQALERNGGRAVARHGAHEHPSLPRRPRLPVTPVHGGAEWATEGDPAFALVLRKA